MSVYGDQRAQTVSMATSDHKQCLWWPMGSNSVYGDQWSQTVSMTTSWLKQCLWRPVTTNSVYGDQWSQTVSMVSSDHGVYGNHWSQTVFMVTGGPKQRLFTWDMWFEVYCSVRKWPKSSQRNTRSILPLSHLCQTSVRLPIPPHQVMTCMTDIVFIHTSTCATSSSHDSYDWHCVHSYVHLHHLTEPWLVWLTLCLFVHPPSPLHWFMTCMADIVFIRMSAFATSPSHDLHDWHCVSSYIHPRHLTEPWLVWLALCLLECLPTPPHRAMTCMTDIVFVQLRIEVRGAHQIPLFGRTICFSF